MTEEQFEQWKQELNDSDLQQTRDDGFDLQLTIAIEEQMEAERYLFEPPYNLFADDEHPITEEELFHIIKEQEISEQENTQY